MMKQREAKQAMLWYVPQYVVDFGDGWCKEEEEGWTLTRRYA